jgi:hypothetical protein
MERAANAANAQPKRIAPRGKQRVLGKLSGKPETGKARRTPRRAFQWETGPLTATDLSIRHGP